MSRESGAAYPDFQAMRLAATLKAARDFGLDREVVNAISLRFDPRRPDLARISEALADALLTRSPLEVPYAA